MLGLIRVENLSEAIEIQNSSEFGLTGGLHSLDPDEIDLWREKVEVGNAYINRTTTGAIVRRQPFGGWKDSCVGPGSKAGGPNYVSTFCDWEESDLPKQRSAPSAETRSMLSRLCTLFPKSCERLNSAAESYAYWWDKEFSIEHDPSELHGQTNHFRYLPRNCHVIRFQTTPNREQLESCAPVALACRTIGIPLWISVAESSEEANQFCNATHAKLYVESNEEFVDQMKSIKDTTIRIVGDYDPFQYSPAEIGNLPIVTTSVFANGRIEMLNYLKEQSVSETIHRYGNIFD